MDIPSKLSDSPLINVEFSGGNAFAPLDAVRRCLDDLVARGLGIRIHNYFPPPRESFIFNMASPDSSQAELSINLARQAIDLCAEFGIPYYSLHPGYLRHGGVEKPDGHFAFAPDANVDYKTALNAFNTNFKAILDYATDKNVALAIENLFPRDGVQDSLNNTFDELKELLSDLPSRVGILLDLGHLNIAANHFGFNRLDYIDGVKTQFGDRLFEVHVSGNDGLTDQHLPLRQDDWQREILKSLGTLPGATGAGVDIALEARNLPLDNIVESLELLPCR